MSNVQCSVFGCHNTYTNTAQLKPAVSFYRFPSRPFDKDKRIKWILFTKRKNADGTDWMPTKNARICSRHFINNERSNHPHNPNYVPSIHPTTPRTKGALPRNDIKRFQRAQRRGKDVIPTEAQQSIMELDMNETIQEPFFKDVACQTDTFQVYATTQTTSETQDKSVGDDTRSIAFHGFRSVRQKEDALKDLTSVTLNVFVLLLNLFPKSQPRASEVTQEDKLLMLLMKLKLGISFSALSSIFSVSRTTAKRIFTETLTFLVARTKSFIIWPSRIENQTLMYDCFKKDYSMCRVIIDCTEMKTESPSSVTNHLHLYSHYKGSCTIKYLIGMTPGGLVSFVSEGFGGRSSDTQITTNCGILNLLEGGDVILADKGFPNILTEFAEKNITLVMPPFANQHEKQFSASDMDATCQIASVRVHVERIIQRFKIYNILNNRIPLDLLPYMDDVMQFIAVLVNLQPQIIRKDVKQ